MDQGGGAKMLKWRIESRGSVLLGGAVALVVAGLLWVDGALLALGLAGGLLLVLSGLMGWLNGRNLVVATEIPKVAAAGVELRMRVSLLNRRGLIDGFGLAVTLKTPGGLEAVGRVPWVPAGSGADVDFRETIPGRGRGEGVSCVVESNFPLGLLRFERVLEVEREMVVLPRAVVPEELLAAGNALDAMRQVSSALSESMGEPRGLRSYRAGDAVKAIAWAASLRSQARGGEVLVRELDPPGFHPQQAVVVFHSFGSDGALIRPDRFERAISLLWGTLRHFQGLGVPVVLVADFEQWVPRRVVTRRQMGAAGEMLAGVQRVRGTELHELQGRLADQASEDGVVVISDMPAVSWESQLQPRGWQLVVDVARYERGREFQWRRADA